MRVGDPPHATLRGRVAEHGVAYGVVSLLGESATSVLADSAWDFVILDCQHGPLDEASAADVVRRLAGKSVAILVRVSRLDAALIGRVLDAGADGVIIPTVESADQAAAAVAAVRYPPFGHRSFGPSRSDLGSDPLALAARADCFVMIESSAGLADLRAIVRTPGISGVFVGPADLGLALGVHPDDVIESPAVAEAMHAIVGACEDAGIVPGSFGFSAPHASRLAGAGFSCITTGTDEQQLLSAASSITETLRRGFVGDAALSAHEATPYGRASATPSAPRTTGSVERGDAP